jgi:uncharacterized membrane protein YuzA (DUF378 family)
MKKCMNQLRHSKKFKFNMIKWRKDMIEDYKIQKTELEVSESETEYFKRLAEKYLVTQQAKEEMIRIKKFPGFRKWIQELFRSNSRSLDPNSRSLKKNLVGSENSPKKVEIKIAKAVVIFIIGIAGLYLLLAGFVGIFTIDQLVDTWHCTGINEDLVRCTAEHRTENLIWFFVEGLAGLILLYIMNNRMNRLLTTIRGGLK